MAKLKWYGKALEKDVEVESIKLLTRLGIQGEGIAKQVISGTPDPGLYAILTGDLRASLSSQVLPNKPAVRIGVLRKSAVGRALFYAIYVFLGTHKMRARPVLRTMLEILKTEYK